MKSKKKVKKNISILLSILCASIGYVSDIIAEPQQESARMEEQKEAEEQQQAAANQEEQKKAEEQQQAAANQEEQKKAEEQQQAAANQEEQKKAEEQQQKAANQEEQKKAEEQQQKAANQEENKKVEEQQQEAANQKENKKEDEEHQQHDSTSHDHNTLLNTAVKAAIEEAKKYTDSQYNNFLGKLQNKLDESKDDSIKYANHLIAEVKDNSTNRFKKLEYKIQDIYKDKNIGIAEASALSTIPYYDNKTISLGIGLGNYKNNNAIGIGIQNNINNKSHIRVNIAWSGNETVTIGTGFAIGW
nr:MAG: hypothetical protein ACHINZ_6070 [Candidatus Aschnera chinzeii]